MKFVDEYRDKARIQALAAEVKKLSRKNIALMEVCGGHTMAIHRFGLQSLLPANIKLLSGPGCPVCVSSQNFIDLSIECCRIPGVKVMTYGDLIRVPGSDSSLEKEKASGRDVRIVYSVLEALDTAKTDPSRPVVFLGIGFETTAPATAAALIQAKQEEINNFFVLSAHKVMPPVMQALAEDGLRLDGFIAPGHVSAVTGTFIYNFLAEKYGLGVVVSGFEPSDIMQSVLMLVKQFESGKPAVEIQYQRVVKPRGNMVAQKMLKDVFTLKNDNWRGIGMIPLSGLKIAEAFSQFDAEKRFDLKVADAKEPKGCICGEILRGRKSPPDCSLFGTTCTPENPVGACMVSAEGTCAAYFRYFTISPFN
jgi:hydrogenase expression/formation protein HypD